MLKIQKNCPYKTLKNCQYHVTNSGTLERGAIPPSINLCIRCIFIKTVNYENSI